MNSRLVKCEYCEALVNPKVKWVYGYYEGTNSDMKVMGSIPEGHCPVCRRKLK